MPYGLPSQGGQPVVQSVSAAAWDDPGGASPVSANCFRSEFFQIEPGGFYWGDFQIDLSFIDGSGTAQVAAGIEDDAGGLTWALVSPPLPPGMAGSYQSLLSFMVTGLPTTSNVKLSMRAVESQGPPGSSPPTPLSDQQMWAWNAAVLNSNLFRIFCGAVNGGLVGTVNGFVTQAVKP